MGSNHGRSPGGGNGNLLQYSSLENSMDRGDWQAIVHHVANSQRLLRTHICDLEFMVFTEFKKGYLKQFLS